MSRIINIIRRNILPTPPHAPKQPQPYDDKVPLTPLETKNLMDEMKEEFNAWDKATSTDFIKWENEINK